MVEKKGMNPSSGEEREEKNGGARAGKMEMGLGRDDDICREIFRPGWSPQPVLKMNL